LNKSATRSNRNNAMVRKGTRTLWAHVSDAHGHGGAGILARYGGEEHLQAPPKEMLLAQTEQYVEYSRTGQVVKGLEPSVPRSKYEEDGTAHAFSRRCVLSAA
jgi:hypothetical protein